MLFCALKSRLIELSDNFNIHDIEQPEFVKNDNPEKYLKIVMIKLYPKMGSDSISEEEKSEYFDLLSKLSVMAISNDLRFLDAFNNAYELIVRKKWDSKDYHKYIIPFLKIYKYLLSNHLNKLEI